MVALALIAGAFFAGRAMADGGPTTLAAAIQQAQAGDLPCGESPAATRARKERPRAAARS